MQPAKKNFSKVLSAISMAAGATLAAKAAQAQIMITPYYGQDAGAVAPLGLDATVTSTSPVTTYGNNDANGVFICTDSLGDNGTLEHVNQTGTPTTLSMPVGDYLFIACDAVVTGDSNPDGGKTTGTSSKAAGKAVQPSYLGLDGISMQVPSSDTNGSVLQPVPVMNKPVGTYNGVTNYWTTASINDANVNEGQGDNTSTFQTKNNSGQGVVPVWTQGESNGNAVNGNGQAANIASLGGANVFSPTYTIGTGINYLIPMNGGAAGTASYANATEVFDSLGYVGSGPGMATISPQIQAEATLYWSLSAAGNSTHAASTYAPVIAVDSQVAALPVLVIDVTSSSHPIFAITNSEGSQPVNYGVQLTNAAAPTGVNQGVFTGPGASSNILQVVGSHGGYLLAQATKINNNAGDATNWVEANGFTGGDEELDGFQVDVNGVLANVTQVDYLIAQANSVSGGLGGLNLYDTNNLASILNGLPNPFSSIYNLFLDDSSTTTDKFIGWDVSAANDPSLVGYTITAVAVVPEPMSLGLLALGGVGLMARRNRRKA